MYLAASMHNIGILLFDEVEVLDFAGPYEVFNVANEAAGQRVFNVFTLAENLTEVAARGGLKVTPDYSFETHPPLHVLVVPGGDGRRFQMHNPQLLRWLRSVSPDLNLLLSVCTGAFILGKAGLLNGLRATTYYQRFDEFRATFPAVPVYEDMRYVVNDAPKAGPQVITSAGISAGIDMSLYVVEQLLAKTLGAGMGRATAQHMEYAYNPDDFV